MSYLVDGSYSCTPGIALVAKVLSGKCHMKYTRAAVGNGTIQENQNPKTMTEPAGYVRDAKISAVTNPINGECQVTVQINSADISEGFWVTGILLYAEDPDEGEIPFTYLVLENEPEWIGAADSTIGKITSFDLIASVEEVDKVEAYIDPSTYVTYETAKQLIETTKTELQHSDTKDNTATFTQATTRANIATGESHATIFGKIAKWFADLKAVAFSGKYGDLEGTPQALKNPNALTFTGASTESYDGSEKTTVNIPVSSVAGRTGDVKLTKEDVGLDKVDNTADSQKSVKHAATADNATNAGVADSAVKLETSAGSETQPVYFKDGKPVPCNEMLSNEEYSELKAMLA